MGVGDALPRVLRGCRLSEDDSAGLPEARYRRCILVPRPGLVEHRAAAQCRPASCPQRVLDRRRHTIAGAQWLPGMPPGLRLLRRSEGSFCIHQHEGVHPLVVPLDRLQRCPCRLHRRNRTSHEPRNQLSRLHHDAICICVARATRDRARAPDPADPPGPPCAAARVGMARCPAESSCSGVFARSAKLGAAGAINRDTAACSAETSSSAGVGCVIGLLSGCSRVSCPPR